MVVPSCTTSPRAWLYKDLMLQRKSAANRVPQFPYSHTDPVGELGLCLVGALGFPLFPYHIPEQQRGGEGVGGFGAWFLGLTEPEDRTPLSR